MPTFIGLIADIVIEEEINFPPKPDCRFCKGTGKRYIKKLDFETVCICLFVNHEHCEELGLALGRTASKILKEEFGK